MSTDKSARETGQKAAGDAISGTVGEIVGKTANNHLHRNLHKNSDKLVEHFFRHEHARLMATLCRRVGAQYFDSIEDSIQQALLAGLETWVAGGIPDNPSAWLYKTASNKLIDMLRKQTGHNRILALHMDEMIGNLDVELDSSLVNEIQDDMVRMLFVCCNEEIPLESQLVFALKSLCGFNIREIALRLFISEANVYKRFSRARHYLKQHRSDFDSLTTDRVSIRLAAVHKIIYLLFTEGYLSVSHEITIRMEMCEDAIRLATILVENTVGQVPETYALLALMYFHIARMAARQDDSGGLLLLEHQDRSLWDIEKIVIGFTWLDKSAQGGYFSRYHAEAGIAAEHCIAKSFADTRWDRICENYSWGCTRLAGLIPCKNEDNSL